MTSLYNLTKTKWDDARRCWSPYHPEFHSLNVKLINKKFKTPRLHVRVTRAGERSSFQLMTSTSGRWTRCCPVRAPECTPLPGRPGLCVSHRLGHQSPTPSAWPLSRPTSPISAHQDALPQWYDIAVNVSVNTPFCSFFSFFCFCMKLLGSDTCFQQRHTDRKSVV